jgi:hypothetical protein
MRELISEKDHETSVNARIEQPRLTKHSIILKLKKNMNITSALTTLLGMVTHEGSRMITKTIGDDKHALRLITLANVKGVSKRSFIRSTSFQP